MASEKPREEDISRKWKWFAVLRDQVKQDQTCPLDLVKRRSLMICEGHVSTEVEVKPGQGGLRGIVKNCVKIWR